MTFNLGIMKRSDQWLTSKPLPGHRQSSVRVKTR
jgi:hypothetical protein